MQLSKNLSDAWLAHWVMNTNAANSSLHLITPGIVSERYIEAIKSNVGCVLEKILLWGDLMECSSGLTGFRHQTFSTSYYLAIYTVIAILNSIFTLVRAFAFAYAGLKAAKFIHTKLLNSVFYVRLLV